MYINIKSSQVFVYSDFRPPLTQTQRGLQDHKKKTK